VDNTGVVRIEDTDVDNYAAFGGDGVADSWQVMHFGETWTARAGRGPMPTAMEWTTAPNSSRATIR
jgi:hypothetical protein